METRNPTKVRAGVAGARARWGPPRIVRLDQCDPETARLIRALLAQSPQRTEKAAAEDQTQTPAAAASTEGIVSATPTD